MAIKHNSDRHTHPVLAEPTHYGSKKAILRQRMPQGQHETRRHELVPCTEANPIHF